MSNKERNNSTFVLASENIPTLFLRTAIPIAVGMMVIGLYNLVDGIFIARFVGEQAVGAVSMVFPVQMLIASVAAMISAGTASIITRKLGESDLPGAGIVAGHALQISLIVSLIFLLVGYFYTEAILLGLGVDDMFMADAKAYIKPILLTAGVSVFLPVVADFFRAEGKANAMMQLMLTSSVLNILLDYIFIVPWEMGVSGAAYATIIAQAVALSMGLFFYRKGVLSTKVILTFAVRSWLPIFALGLPILIAQGSMGVQTAAVNYQFTAYGNSSWIITYGMLGRLSTFVVLPLIAMLIAFQTICGYNLGAKLLSRVKASILVSLKAMTLYATVVMFIFLLFPREVFSIFTSDPHLLDTCETLIYNTIWGLPLAGFGMLATGYYQAKGDALHAVFYSGLRVFFIMIPLLWIIPPIVGLQGILLAIVLGDLVGPIVTLLLCIRPFKQLQPEKEYSVA